MKAVATAIPGVRVLVAPNAGPSTHDGTNTYLVAEPDGITIIDAGPALESHVEAILAAAGGPIRRILTTHTHRDHAGAARMLAERAHAPIFGHLQPLAAEFSPDIGLGDGDRIGAITAIFTPGHARDHLCFSFAGEALFSGDTVLDWASSLVRPPNGDMADYIASLERLQPRTEKLYLPGHGPPVTDPQARLADLLARRRHREASIVAKLAAGGATLDDLTEHFYGRKPELRETGRWTLEAHLLKLEKDGRAKISPAGIWALNFHPCSAMTARKAGP